MVSIFHRTLLVLVMALALCNSNAFIPSRGARINSICDGTTSTTELCMGLFDKKPAAKKGPAKKGGNSFLDGRGARITIREDEDNAMWIEEPKDKKPAKKGKK